jgi:hypothetical protein
MARDHGGGVHLDRAGAFAVDAVCRG